MLKDKQIADIVDEQVAVLMQRKGFDAWWEPLPPEIRQDIRDDLRFHVRACVNDFQDDLEASLSQRMAAAVVAQIKAADEWSAFYYITGRAAQTEAIDAAWKRLRDANDELRAVAALIGKGGADA